MSPYYADIIFRLRREQLVNPPEAWNSYARVQRMADLLAEAATALERAEGMKAANSAPQDAPQSTIAACPDP
jgi:hypothetical protein